MRNLKKKLNLFERPFHFLGGGVAPSFLCFLAGIKNPPVPNNAPLSVDVFFVLQRNSSHLRFAISRVIAFNEIDYIPMLLTEDERWKCVENIILPYAILHYYVLCSICPVFIRFSFFLLSSFYLSWSLSDTSSERHSFRIFYLYLKYIFYIFIIFYLYLYLYFICILFYFIFSFNTNSVYHIHSDALNWRSLWYKKIQYIMCYFCSNFKDDMLLLEKLFFQTISFMSSQNFGRCTLWPSSSEFRCLVSVMQGLFQRFSFSLLPFSYFFGRWTLPPFLCISFDDKMLLLAYDYFLS